MEAVVKAKGEIDENEQMKMHSSACQQEGVHPNPRLM
jgi:hypothetical protein